MLSEQIESIDSNSYLKLGKFVMVKLEGDSFRRAEIYEVNHETKKIKVYTFLMGRKMKSSIEIDFQDVREETPEEQNFREGVEKNETLKEQEYLESLLPEDKANFEFIYRMMRERKIADHDTYSFLLECFTQPYENSIQNLWFEVKHAGQSNEEKSEILKIIQLLLKKSHESSAVRWLSTKDPRFDTEQRLRLAKESAEKSGKTLEEIARAHGLEHLIK